MSSLTVRELTIKHTVGFPRAGLPTMRFCDGLNIIYGPNASGKTTTARAIQALLWPASDTQESFLTAEVAVDGQVGRYQCLGGARTGEPALGYPGDAGIRHRYMLAQHELLTAGDADTNFADLILQEARGGLDLQGAMAQLGYHPPGRPQSLKDYTDAGQAYRQARDAERAIARVEEDLLGLGRQLAEARAAQGRLARLTLALEYLAQGGTEADAADALALFPPELAVLTGHELDELREQTVEIAGAEAEIAQAGQALAGAEDDRTRTGLSDPAVVERVGALVEGQCAEIEKLDALIAAQEVAIASAARAAESAFANLGGQAKEADRPLSVTVVQELGEFVHRAEKATAGQQALTDLLQWLSSVTPAADPLPADRLREGVDCLQEWLACGEASTSPALSIVALLTALCALLAAVITRSPFAVLALVGILVAWMLTRRRTPGLPRAAWAERFAAQGIEAPATWSKLDVEGMLRELRARVTAAQMVGNAAVKRAELQAALAAGEEKLQALAPDAARIAGLIGVEAARVLERPHALSYYVEHLATWQAQRRQAESARAELAVQVEVRQAVLDNANAALAPFGYTPAESTGEVRNLFRLLEGRKNAHTTADTAAKNTRTQIEKAETRRDESLRKRTALLTRLALGEEPDAVRGQLAALLPRLPAYRTAQEALTTATVVRAATARKGEAWSEWPSLVAQDETSLRDEREAAQALAEGVEPLSHQIGDYERQVTAAKEQAACEAAQVKLERVTAQLRRKLEETLRAGVGWYLTNQVETQVLDAGLPDVFQRAQELFAVITQGRYDLHFDALNKVFYAEDRVEGLPRLLLDQLSSGTRVQLLIAVRVAFVERREQGARLPLLMDETLACSDDGRERAIIDSALRICAQGRQVFYFTSKPAELAKWQAHAKAAAVPCTLINLADTPPEAVVAPGDPLPALPAPAGREHDAYGPALGVAEVDFSRGTAGQAHVWYVVDDPTALHTLVQAGIITCGQLGQPHLARLLDGLLGPDDARRACTRATLLTTLERLWWEGRGTPLTYPALEASGILSTSSESIKNEIPALAEELSWDAAGLLAALERGQVKRVRTDSIARLRAYCEEHGHLVAGVPLAADALYEHLLAAATEAITLGVLAPHDVRTLFHRVFQGVPA